MFSPGDPLLDPLEFERERPSGRFAPGDVQPDGSVPPDRGPSGRFVSPDREPIDNMSRDPLGVYNANPPGRGMQPAAADRSGFAAHPEAAAGSSMAEAFETEAVGRGVSPDVVDEPAEREGLITTAVPSAQTLPHYARANLAAGDSADMAFVEAEEQRAREAVDEASESVFLEGQSLNVADTAVGWAEMDGLVPEGTREALEDTNGAELDRSSAADVARALEGYQEHEQQIADEGRSTIMGSPESHQQWADWTEEARDDLEPQLF